MHQDAETSTPRNDRIAVLIPVYDNERTIESVVRGGVDSGLPVLVVDDAATDRTPEILEELQGEGVSFDVVRCPENLGKAGALRLGFDALRERGCTTAISVDADLQHDPTMIASFRDVAERDPHALVVGCRWPLHPSQPRRNLIGRTFSNVAVRLHCGVAVGDAPCGFRAWPLEPASEDRGRSGRYAWEQEMITRLAWRGTPVRSLDVPAIYHSGDDRVSHYRFGRDWPEGIAIYLWLLVSALVPLPGSGWRRGTLRRISRLLSPGPLRGDRPEVRTNRWASIAVLGVAAVLGGTLPTSPWTLAAVGWVGWRWHAGLAAILLAGGGSWASVFGQGVDAWYWPAIVAWCLGGFLRRPGSTLEAPDGVVGGRTSLVDPAG